LNEIIARYSTNQDYQPYNLVEEFEKRGLFVKRGEQYTTPMRFGQSIDDYIESFHARNGLSRKRMGVEQANTFDREMRELVCGFSSHGRVELQVRGYVVCGIPQASKTL
jgi:hypothetical protein